ncbi:unnamed protein product [Withania somnifera]
MRVHMDCSKIRKALNKLHDMNMQKVTVTEWAEQKKVLKTARKTGRRAELWPYPYNPEYHNYMHHYYNTFYRRRSTYFAPPSSSFDERTRHIFSDDNATSCSIM